MKLTSYKPETIDHHIGLVRKDGEKLRNKIHSLAISILKAWHDDPKGKSYGSQWAAERITALQNASPYHSKSFADWVAIQGVFAA